MNEQLIEHDLKDLRTFKAQLEIFFPNFLKKVEGMQTEINGLHSEIEQLKAEIREIKVKR